MGANVRLSAEEMRLVTDPAWILTKNSIIGKVVEMFGQLSGEWRAMGWPAASELAGMVGMAGMAGLEPKVSKGEQYKGLPWVMLDYPRVFGKEDVMAVRTMFWWGHCFSVTLHLKGSYLRSYLPVILANRIELEAAGFSPGAAEDEWEHEHSPGTWQSLGDGSPGGREFAKISANVDLDQWNQAPEILTKKFTALSRILVTP